MSDHDQPTLPTTDHLDPATTRRTVLRAAGLVALTGTGATTLVACAADREAATAPSSAAPSPAASSSAAAPSTEASSAAPSESASEEETQAAPKGPSVDTADVPVGGGVILDDADYVVTQPTKGDFKAFSKICTHQGCPVTEISGSNIVCKCHGSAFSIKDGSVTSPPADKALKESKVTVFKKKAYIST